MSPEEKIQNQASKEKAFRDAIRWLFEAERFASSYGGDSWRGDGLSKIGEIAQEAHREAIKLVIAAHKEMKKSKQ